MYDYSDNARKIFRNGYLVRSLTVIGVAAEQFLKLAIHYRRGFNALSWWSVKSVEMRGVIINGVSRSSITVEVPRRDAEIALRLARAVVERLEQVGFRMLDAIVPQRDARNTVVGEHDLVAERSGQTGKSSIEIKCRTFLDGCRRDEFRRQLQKDTCTWWPTAVARPNHGWAERVCALVEFSSRGADVWSALRCESLPAEAKDEPAGWTPLFGWASRLGNSGGASSAKAPAPKKAPAKPCGARAASPDVSAARKRGFAAAFAKSRACILHGQEIRSVSDLVTEMGTPAAKRAKPTIGEKMLVWAKRFSWAPRAWARTPRLASRTGGGRQGICATQAALEDIHKALY